MKTIQGYYGSGNTPCDIFVDDSGWYCVEGSNMANQTDIELLENGINVEVLPDFDCFTWSDTINTEDEFDKALEA